MAWGASSVSAGLASAKLRKAAEASEYCARPIRLIAWSYCAVPAAPDGGAAGGTAPGGTADAVAGPDPIGKVPRTPGGRPRTADPLSGPGLFPPPSTTGLPTGGKLSPGRGAPGGGAKAWAPPAETVPAAAQFMVSPAPNCCADKVQSR